MENNQNTYSYNQGKDLSSPMTLGDWVKTLLLLLIPVVNIILIFVWAFGSNVNKSKKTYFQAQLIMIVIYIVLWIVFAGTIFTILTSLVHY